LTGKKVYYVTHVLKQNISIKTMCPKYIIELRNTKSHLLQVLSSGVGNEKVKIELTWLNTKNK